ncbi:MAG: type II toxin-antitoxin system RelE/ParE family toxin [Deltaproteobacteria bacterium]|nr:type II toxin-antitoxin system RelE/ParE family toxin [Deltaproteobacteria bacterium]
MKIAWTADALADLVSLRAYIASENPKAASDVANRILDGVRLLTKTPGMGRRGRVPDTRELLIRGTPFFVSYRRAGRMVQILRVMHFARRWP